MRTGESEQTTTANVHKQLHSLVRRRGTGLIREIQEKKPIGEGGGLVKALYSLLLLLISLLRQL